MLKRASREQMAGHSSVRSFRFPFGGLRNAAIRYLFGSYIAAASS